MKQTCPAIIRYHYDENYTEESLKEEIAMILEIEVER